MPREKPLYLKKSKAAKEAELDYFYTDSDSYTKQFEKDYSRIKSRKTKNQYDYKKTYNFPYYEDQINDRKAYKYDEDPYFVTDYSYYVDDNRYLDYVMENSTASSEGESVLDTHHHKPNKDGKKKQSEKLYYDHKSKHKEGNGFRKQKSSKQSNGKNRILGDKNDFNVYISQRPITLKLKNQDSLREQFNTGTKKGSWSKEEKIINIPKSNLKPPQDHEMYSTDLTNIPPDYKFGYQQQGDSFQIYNTTLIDPYTYPNDKEMTKSISHCLAQSVLRLIYLPVFVMSNNSVPQSTGSVDPALLFNNENNQPHGTEVVIGSQNLSVFPVQNNDQNNVFEQKTKSMKNERKDSTLIQMTKENVSKELLERENKNKLKKKLVCAQSLGSAMSPESYATLIVTHSDQKPNTLPSLIKVCKQLKDKKITTPNNKFEETEDENEYQKQNLSVKSVNKTSNTSSHPTMNHNTKQEKENTKGKRENQCMNSKIADKGINKKSPSNVGRKVSEIKIEDEEQMDDEKDVTGRPNPNLFTSENQSQVKEINPKSNRKIDSKNLITTNYEMIEIKGTELRNIEDPEQNIGGCNKGSSLDKNNDSKKSGLDFKNHSIVSQDPMIIGNYKKVGYNHSVKSSRRSFALPEKGRSFMGDTSNTAKNNFHLREHNSYGKTASINKPKIIAQTEEGRVGFPPENDENEIIMIQHGNSFQKEISIDEIKETSGTKVKTREETKLDNNPIGILKKENLSSLKGINTGEEKELNENNSINCEESKGKPQQQNGNLTSISNKEQLTKQNLKKTLSGSGDKDQQVERLEKVHQSSPDVVSEQGVENKSNLQIQQRISRTNQLIHDQLGRESPKDSMVEKPSVDVIYPPHTKSLESLDVKSISNVFLSQNEELDEPLTEYPLKLSEYTEAFLVISFNTVQYILGVSCFDKLFDVIDFFYFDSD